MIRFFSLLIAASFALSTAAYAAGLERVRGVIASSSGTTLVVTTAQGQNQTIQLDSKTLFAAASRSSLAAIQPGGYIGTATKTVGNSQVALEVAVFPPEMRGVGEGHYPWDNIADTTAGGAAVQSNMTNGNVMSAMPPMNPTSTMMTNGNVQTANSEPGDERLVVTYKGGQQVIMVPPGTPVVALAPANASVMKAGASVFVVAKPGPNGLEAVRVTVGTDGVKLPM